ncbi:extracellular solute-binding protein [Kribbella karoonensis]|uniref:Extracellular solute-binding protein n=1 Tax=Kribbella karoonensis TaxID=324851 RepID=A0ABN2CZN5_9ACTN
MTPGSSSAGKPDQPATIKKLTPDEVRALGDVTLTMTDFDPAGQGLGAALDKLVAQFHAAYPNVTVHRTSKDFNSYSKTIKLTLSEADAPDIAQANVVMARTLVPAGLVRPLDGYYDAYAWRSRYPSSVLDLLRAKPDGKTLGDGKYWGQAIGGNMVGVYYNAATLKKLGLSVPRTYGEFERDLQVAKDNDVLPVQLGNLEQWPANHVLSTLMNVTEDPQVVRDWIRGKPGATFETPGIVAAAQTLRDWEQKGYLPANANGVTNDRSIADFGAGQGLFYITGSWQIPRISAALKDDGGFFLLPPKTAGGPAAATGWLANPYTISAKSRKADLAAFFLDYLGGPAGTTTAVAGGFLPFGDLPAGFRQSRTASDVTAAWRAAIKDNGLVPYLDFATPSLGDAAFPAIQSVMAGKLQPTAFAHTVQENWNDYHSGS